MTIPMIWYVAPLGAITAMIFAFIFYMHYMKSKRKKADTISILFHPAVNISFGRSYSKLVRHNKVSKQE